MASQTYANFSVRVSSETAARRERIQRATGWSTPHFLESVFRNFEERILAGLSDDDRAAYMAGSLTREQYLDARRRHDDWA